MAAQDEMIAKLKKDKAAMDEGQKKTLEALQAEEDKVNHLNKLKQKLESTLDEVGINNTFYKSEDNGSMLCGRNVRGFSKS